MAASLNKVFLIGRLGQDPKLAYTTSGMPVVNFSLATDEGYTDKNGKRVDKTEWHRIVVFNKQAEFCANYLSKGRLIFVEGRLQTREWQDQQGQTRYTTEIIASRIQALDPKGTSTTSPNATAPAPEQTEEEDLGPTFPSEVAGMDDAPF
ncbi:single-strand DNA-binding protein [Desulfonauticus submarinus]|uniref:Single-stranded DNA-binding protein n=1 Tax=Desulfonauticus submarinus TaxID=206665 RepID=A0A1H0F191_9BACT|nr:single-stranded DNA-binding protein [Desulfonauticus submarinus]SDN88437.1 single-strand DNA-binding protein [Desulfonauticus submarinus]